MHLQQRLRKKKEGAAEIKLPIQLSTGFYGNKSRFVWLEKVPAPPAQCSGANTPGLYLCGQLFFCVARFPCPHGSPATTPIATEAKRKEEFSASELN